MNERTFRFRRLDEITNAFNIVENLHPHITYSSENQRDAFRPREVWTRNYRAFAAGDEDDETLQSYIVCRVVSRRAQSDFN